MRRLTAIAAVLGLALVGNAAAEDDLMMPGATPAPSAASAPAASTPSDGAAPGGPTAASTAVASTASESAALDVSASSSGGGMLAHRSRRMEAGLFLGGFISNYYHQFYNPSLETGEGTPQRPELDRVMPSFGARFAYFVHPMVAIEGEGSIVLAATRMGDSAQIHGLSAQAVVQKQFGRVTPFAAAGFGLRHISSDDDVLGSDTDWPIHAGVGARYWLSDGVAVRADARLLRGPSYPHDGGISLNASYGEFMLGVSFNPSGIRREPPPPPPPPDPDPDRDGVLDPDDKCPTENGGSNADGCPTRDMDGDGVVDANDKCVDQAETVNTFEDEDGCPDTVPDTDADGFDDLVDKCKEMAEDKDQFEDEDGCPDPDNDGDGVVDAKDKCPAVTGPMENGGCPDTDGDSDGVVDRLDNCPEEKGDAKNQGCKAKQLVVITKDQLKILDQVKFVTGSAKLSPASNKLLDNIAMVLLTHLDIWKVKVEGHTDNIGDPIKNMKLSQDRAQSVVNYLVKKGVAPERLEAVGHGDTKPLEDNASKKGKAANRRVEFNIVAE